MKKLICLTLLAVFISVVFAQKRQEKSALQSMVDTERAFARMSEEQGIRPAFMAFIADDGILFRPTAVKGKKWMMEYPLPPSDKRPLLSWQPTFADVARAGDMGYTTGPWEYKADIHDAKPVAFGNFLTVWKKQPDGSWKFAIDLGISNTQPAQAATPWQPPKNYRQATAARRIDIKSETNALFAREREFSNASATRDAQRAFDAYAADDVRVFRNDKQPFVGKAAAAAVALPASSIVWTWQPAFADVSQSGDLGYSYGTYELVAGNSSPKTPKMAAKVEVGNYYRIWKRQGNNWKVVADLLDPLPEPKELNSPVRQTSGSFEQVAEEFALSPRSAASTRYAGFGKGKPALFSLGSAGPVFPSCSTATAHFVSLLLKLCPLLGSQNFLQFFVGLPADFFDPRLRFFSKRLELLSRVAQYLMDLRFLVGVELKSIKHAFKLTLPRCFGAAPVPSVVSVQGEGASREAEQEDYNRRHANLPFAFVDDVHALPPGLSS